MLLALFWTGWFGCSSGHVGPLADWCQHPDALLKPDATDGACPTAANLVPKPLGECGGYQWAMLPERTDATNSNHFFYEDGQLVGVSLIGPDTSGATPYFGERPFFRCDPCLTTPRSRLTNMPICGR